MKVLPLLLCVAQFAAADAARDALWTQDTNYLATQLVQRHPNLFFKTPRADFDAAVANLKGAIPNLSDDAVMTGLAAIAALPGDAHTNLYLTHINGSFRQLPIQLQWFEDGLFVIGAGANYAQAIGGRVLQIGDLAAEDAFHSVATIISYENEIYARYFSPYYLTNADILQTLKIAPDNASVSFVILDPTGKQYSLDIASLPPGTPRSFVVSPDPSSGFIPLARQHLDQNYWFTYLAGSGTLYFAYNLCEQMSGLPFSSFNNQLWAAFEANPVKAFVIDLRNNPGGDTSVLTPFLSSQAQRKGRFGAIPTMVILGRETFSSAINNAISLAQQFSNSGPFEFLGEPTGGSPNSYGEVLSFTLPNSKLVVNYSTKYFSYPSYPPGSLLPGISVNTYSSDYFARYDPFLAALPMTQTFAAPPPASLTTVSSASFRSDQPVAPGSLASVFGDFSGISSGDATGLPLSTQLNGVQVLVNGTLAPILAIRSSLINIQVPYMTPAGAVPVRVFQNGSEIVSGFAAIGPDGPGIFVADPFNVARPGAIRNEDYSLNSFAAPASRGSVVQLYGTGQGATTPEVPDGAAPPGPPALAQSNGQPTVVFGTEPAEVLYSGLVPGLPGLWQMNVRVPSSSPVGEVPIYVVLGSTPSSAVTVQVQ